MNRLYIFTDGGCINNGKNTAVAGIGIHFPDKQFDDISEQFTVKPITNQRAELYAIYKALTVAVSKPEYNAIQIYSDSRYSIKCVTEWIKTWVKNNWKTCNKKDVKNLDIIKPIYQLIQEFNGIITFEHVKSHTGNTDYKSVGNDNADKLATKAMA